MFISFCTKKRERNIMKDVSALNFSIFNKIFMMKNAYIFYLKENIL